MTYIESFTDIEYEGGLSDILAKALSGLQGGGPGSGRHKDLSHMVLKNDELLDGAVRVKGVFHVPVGGHRKLGMTDLGDGDTKEEMQPIVDKLKGKPGFENVQVVKLKTRPAGTFTRTYDQTVPGGWKKGEVVNYPAHERYTVAWGSKEHIAQLKSKLVAQDHIWLGKAFGYKYPRDTSASAIDAGGPGSGRRAYGAFLQRDADTLVKRYGSNLAAYKWAKDERNIYTKGTGSYNYHSKLMSELTDRYQEELKPLDAGGPGSGRRPGLDTLSREEKLAERRRVLNQKRAVEREAKKPFLSDKAKLAMKHMNVATKDVHDKAELAEQNIHQALKGSLKSKDNAPFDVVHNGHGIEVKAIISQKNDKITQKGEAINRKMRFAKANKLKGMHTVAVDYRGASPVVYHRSGVGSFRLGNMTKVKGGFSGLGKHIK